MTNDVEHPSGRRPDALERRAAKIAGRRFVLVAIGAVLLGLAAASAVVMRIVDPDAFPTLGTAMWWAVSTFTTVGYGDVVPSTGAGRVMAALLMVTGITFLSFLTAAVTTEMVRREKAEEADGGDDRDAILDGIARLEARLARVESRLPG